MAIFIHVQVNIALYGYRQDLPDTLEVLRRTDQGAILIHIQVNIALYGYTQDLPDTLSVLCRADEASQRRPGHPK